MVFLTITQAMLDALQYLADEDKSSPGSHGQAESLPVSPQLHGLISHEQIINLADRLRIFKMSTHGTDPANVPSHNLEHLLRGSRIYVEPQKPKAQPSAEYKSLMAQLRREEEARAYDHMRMPHHLKESFAQRFPNSQHAHLFPTSKDDVGDEDEVAFQDVNRQIAVIINVLVSILACGAALWIIARHWSIPSRLGLSMGGGGTVGIAEVVVYAGYLRRVKEAKAKSKNEKEVKEIVETWVIQGHKNDEEPLKADQSADNVSSTIRKRSNLIKKDG